MEWNDKRFEAAMIEKYAPVVRRIATRLQRIRPAFLDHDDAVQDGMIGLLRAIRANGQSGDGKQFQSYIRTCVHGAIIDNYRVTSGISRRDYANARKIQRAMAQGLAVAPAEREMARWVMTAAWIPPEPLDGDDAANLSAPHPGPEQRLMCNQLLRRAVDALQQVSVRDRTIFIACEVLGDKQVDVAADFKISIGRVSQIIKEVRRGVTLAAG